MIGVRQARWRMYVARVGAALAMALSAFVVHAGLAPSGAMAACNDGDPVTDFWIVSGQVYAVEESRESCNGDGVYLGKVFDVLTDGSCVNAQYTDGSFTGVQGVSCDSAGFNYSFWDQTGNTSANYRVYVSYHTPPYIAISGY